MRFFLLSVVLAGCGGSPFVGVWSGTITTAAAACSDGSAAPSSSAAVVFKIEDEGGGRVGWDAQCAHLSAAAVDGQPDMAVGGPFQCASQGSLEIGLGNLSLALEVDNDALQVDYTLSEYTAAANCHQAASGLLTRVR